MTEIKGPVLQHLAINVRDIEASHRFYTDVLGFEHCGTLETPPQLKGIDMRFCRGDESRHHDFAIVQAPDPSPFPKADTEWEMFANRIGINHIAICYPSREAFLARLEHLRRKGVPFRMRGNHGMTHSLYVSDPDGNGIEILYNVPKEAWEKDVNAALSYWEPMPLDGEAALKDSTDYHRF
jgi:catechol 2,3-dioxygenase